MDGLNNSTGRLLLQIATCTAGRESNARRTRLSREATRAPPQRAVWAGASDHSIEVEAHAQKFDSSSHAGRLRLDPAQFPLACAEQLEQLIVVLFDGAPMADADHDTLWKFGAQQLVKRKFQPFVERRRGLIQEHRLRLGEQDAGEGDPLLLAGG